MTSTADNQGTRFARYALGFLLYNLGVIAWGAYVRASGSGAGCADRWPLCNGQLIPREPSVQTLVEYTHRVTSGLSLVGAVLLVALARRSYAQGAAARKAAWWALGFMLVEAAVGAGLVLLELVGQNSSVTRAVVMALHLANTFLLLAALAASYWHAQPRPRLQCTGRVGLSILLAIGTLALIVLGASGGVTALGDTLFPAASLVGGLAQDLSPTAHFLVRLRIWHPALAFSVGAYVAFCTLLAARKLRRAGRGLIALALLALYLGQLGLGLANLMLLAPIWLQLLHLLLADLIWITWLWMSASVLTLTPEATRHPGGPRTIQPASAQ